MTVDKFIARWEPSGASERANYQMFFADLCTLLDVSVPDPSSATNTNNAYVFERSITVPLGDGSSTTNYIDVYRRSAFIFEAKQGSEIVRPGETALLTAPVQKSGTAKRGTLSWDRAMVKARAQAEGYARALPASEGRPPFIIVADVGYSLELYSEFTQTGGVYVPYPSPSEYRIMLTDLHKPEVRARLRAVWLDPLSLDPARRSARATREIAQRLAILSRSLEAQHDPRAVNGFLMRLIFTMFAEDLGLLPKGKFTAYLQGIVGHAVRFEAFITPLWQTMNTGGFSPQLADELLHFNGGLFADPSALPLTEEQLRFVIEVSEQEWGDVEPAIFGTLLERALDPRERHRLGAHYTPRAYVERLVNQTVLEPLRERWAAVQVEFSADLGTLERLQADPTEAKDAQGMNARIRAAQAAAIKKIEVFHKSLCAVRVLDPACGSGNFLYVALEMMKRLEGEVLDALERVGGDRRLEMDANTVDPHQFLGIELNPRAAQIAELVLWIGYLQWHFRTHGNVTPPTPVLKAFKNIECRDAVIDYDRKRPLTDASGAPITRWDGVTTHPHPVTGQNVPDTDARVQEYEYVKPRKAVWPSADYVVGNPPFIGSKRMRELLGDGYVDAVQAAWPEVPQATDFVLRWWHHAAVLAREGKVKRFGFITTNSISQTYNRRAIEPHLNAKKQPLRLLFAISDHPWVDATDGAAVRIAMTVGSLEHRDGVLTKVVKEAEELGDGENAVLETSERDGKINSDLTIGVDLSVARPLASNAGLCAVGMKTIGEGFQVTQERALQLGLGTQANLELHIRPYLNGRDLTQHSRERYVIDFFGLDETTVRSRFPMAYQHLLETARPERLENRNVVFKRLWWVIGHPRPIFRQFAQSLARYIVTLETAKHRVFQFVNAQTVPDSSLVTFGLDDGYSLGVLSSRVHVVWALAAGGTLEDRPRYNKSVCFEPFPFPAAIEQQHKGISELAEQIDAHRKRQLALHPSLTLTEMYNTLETLRAGRVLTDKEMQTNTLGLVSTLLELHQKLDALVLLTYGWAGTLTDAEILAKLVALNLERQSEEAKGTVRYLRPAYQNPSAAMRDAALELPDDEDAPVVPVEIVTFPKTLGEQSQAIRNALKTSVPLTAKEVAGRFKGAKVARVAELLELLGGLGQVSAVEGGRYGA